MAEKITSILESGISSVNERMTSLLGGNWILIVVLILLVIFVVPNLGIWEYAEPAEEE